MSETIDNDRRRFFGSAIMTLAAARLGMNTREAESGRREPRRGATMTEEYGMTKPSGNMFDSIKQIDAGVLNVGYAEAGPANGPPVILLHGWPYDIHAFEEVAPILAAKG